MPEILPDSLVGNPRTRLTLLTIQPHVIVRDLLTDIHQLAC